MYIAYDIFVLYNLHADKSLLFILIEKIVTAYPPKHSKCCPLPRPVFHCPLSRWKEMMLNLS